MNQARQISKENTIKIKRLTKLYDSCEECGLPIINCICEALENTDTEIQFWILSSLREFYRPSNTARLIKRINPKSTEVFLWERTAVPEELVRRIESNDYALFLLFPAETEEQVNRSVDYIKSNKKTAFIILDGTWTEARRIMRKASYLSEIPIVSLTSDRRSSFDLRKGAAEGQLCTIEAATEILRLNGEIANMECFQRGFHLFMKAYKASVSGHKMKIEG